jgi:hypothetical protein
VGVPVDDGQAGGGAPRDVQPVPGGGERDGAGVVAQRHEHRRPARQGIEQGYP